MRCLTKWFLEERIGRTSSDFAETKPAEDKMGSSPFKKGDRGQRGSDVRGEKALP